MNTSKLSGKSCSCFFPVHSGPEAVSSEILATVSLHHVLLQHYLPISGQCHVWPSAPNACVHVKKGLVQNMYVFIFPFYLL